MVSTRAWATDQTATAVAVPASGAKSAPPPPPPQTKGIFTAKNALGYLSKSITGSKTLARILDPHLIFRQNWAILIHSPRVDHFERVCTDEPHSSNYRNLYLYIYFCHKKTSNFAQKLLQQGRSLHDTTRSAIFFHANHRSREQLLPQAHHTPPAAHSHDRAREFTVVPIHAIVAFHQAQRNTPSRQPTTAVITKVQVVFPSRYQ